MKTILWSFLFFFLFSQVNCQYVFTNEINIPCSTVKNQQMTGTCWSFGTTSFIESEILRIKKVNLDLSEMYNVRMTYLKKAQNYVLRQGKANFGEGGLPHDVINVINEYGIVPLDVYNGKTAGDTVYDHAELQPALTGFLDAVIKAGKPTIHWMPAFNGILDAYLGALPLQFTYKEKSYTPQTLRDAMGINTKNYLSFTSFNHHPFYQNFILEIPDNFANGSFFNIKLDELMHVIDFALENGYSIAWDADVSEKGFSGKSGIAILPVITDQEDLFAKPLEEIQVTETNRQQNFMNYKTTDDHIMHIVGRAHDQNGKKYYIIKNSWGTRGAYNGFDYVSEAFMKMKTLSVTLHRDGVPKEILSKMTGSW
jgi:bleomycin hydrolase